MDQNMPKNFGLCEITSRIYNGGIIYLLILIYIYSTFFNNYFKNTEKITKKFVFLSICIFAIYARVFTMYDETFLIALLYSIFNFTMSKDIKNN